MTLRAVPDPKPHDLGDVPEDWPDLRASFVLSLRAAKRSRATVATYCDGSDASPRSFMNAHRTGWSRPRRVTICVRSSSSSPTVASPTTRSRRVTVRCGPCSSS